VFSLSQTQSANVMGGRMSTVQRGEPRPIISGLAPFYQISGDLSYLLIRVTAGGLLLAHGIIKLMTTTVAAHAAGSLARRGIEPALPLTYFVWFLETVGATCIILGLFTRFFAAAIAVEMAVITFVASWPNGFAFSNPRGGWEFPFLWGLVYLAIALRGGGPYSLDRKIGREL
jgi:putative oxidoreductase